MACREHPVCLVQLDPQDGREIQEQLDHQELQVSWELQEPQEDLV